MVINIENREISFLVRHRYVHGPRLKLQILLGVFSKLHQPLFSYSNFVDLFHHGLILSYTTGTLSHCTLKKKESTEPV